MSEIDENDRTKSLLQGRLQVARLELDMLARLRGLLSRESIVTSLFVQISGERECSFCVA